ncbi:MAG: hypothetical protein HY926_14530 [Elusimicrobia bacterium]|nr:hypothetical protein [Elusimicrobiota bacterium]
MTDIQLAVLLAALAVLAWYVRGGLERESGTGGPSGPRPAADADSGWEGLALLLWGHGASLLLCIPLLAYPPAWLDDGHSMGRWLSDYLRAWLFWAGAVQLLYAVPLWRGRRAAGRPLAARVLLLAAGATAAASALAWAFSLNRRHASLSLQAGSGILALAAFVALLWCGRELRRSLRA